MNSTRKNISKLKRYRTPEDLKKHEETTHKTDQNAFKTPEVKVWCVTCKAQFNYFSELSEHYNVAHKDEYRAKYAGICDMCSGFAQVGFTLPGGTPETVYQTYDALKTHYKQVHWSSLTGDAKEHLENNTIGLTRGSM